MLSDDGRAVSPMSRTSGSGRGPGASAHGARWRRSFSWGPNPHIDRELELARWLSVSRDADAAAGFRAGWDRMARWVQPRLQDWERRWWSCTRENDSLRSRIG